MEQFLQDLEASLGVPAALLERAAAARAGAEGSSADSVVRSWAGVGDAPAAPAAAAPEPIPPAAGVTETPVVEAPVAAAPTAPAAEAAGGAPQEFLADLVSSLEVPAALLERAAAARGAASGRSSQNVVRSWAGVGDAPAAPAAAVPAVPAADSPEKVPEVPAAAAPAAAAPAAPPSGLVVEVLEASVPSSEATDPEVTHEEPAGVLAGFPGWLSAALLAIPILALSYVLIAPNGPGCGTSGQLAIDAETGLAESCDGTEYGVEGTSYFTVGAKIFEGSGKCAGCHGDDGSGGTGPAMLGGAVLNTFPGGSCADHITWVSIGTDEWPEATYGANATPVGSSGASMPSFAEKLSPEELAAVVIYERVAFGGQLLADAEADCGTEAFEIAGG